MLELSPARKNKINLNDYNFEQDIENRMLMADFSSFDLEVLEEILYSPLKIAVKKLCRAVGCEESELLPSLKKLSQGGLLALQDDTIAVDKERRKYFEFQITRFDPAFHPDMEFLQHILKKVPIHILPTWYSIPRSSNNIFESIVEKYLLSPQIFHRYLMELNLGDPILNGIIQDVFRAPEFKVSSSDLIAKYNLARRDFEEITLLLEFNFVCCVAYEKEDDHWLEFVTPFHEWRQYLLHLKETEAPKIAAVEEIRRRREADFAFVEDMGVLLQMAKKKPISIPAFTESALLPLPLAKDLANACSIPFASPQEQAEAQVYLTQVIEKMTLVKLADRIENKIYALESANDWIDMSMENRALYLYRHQLNQILTHSVPAHLTTERHIREAEKSIKRVLHGGWVYFDDFIKGALIPMSEDSVIMLKRTGKHWKYTLPVYSDEEKSLIKATVFEWLFETGIVATGICNGKDCFAATHFGRFFFED